MRYFTLGRGGFYTPQIPRESREGRDSKGNKFTFKSLPKWLWGGISLYQNYGTRFSRTQNIDIGHERARRSTHQGMDLQPLENDYQRDASIIWPLPIPGQVIARGQDANAYGKHKSGRGNWLLIRPVSHLFEIAKDKQTAPFIFEMYHFDSIAVQKGNLVFQGTVLGKMGNTGQSSGAHAHFQIKNPQNLFFDPFHSLFTDLNTRNPESLKFLTNLFRMNNVDSFIIHNAELYRNGYSRGLTVTANAALRGASLDTLKELSRSRSITQAEAEHITLNLIKVIVSSPLHLQKWVAYTTLIQDEANVWKAYAAISAIIAMCSHSKENPLATAILYLINNLAKNVWPSPSTDPTLLGTLGDAMTTTIERMDAYLSENYREVYPKPLASTYAPTATATLAVPTQSERQTPSPDKKQGKGKRRKSDYDSSTETRENTNRVPGLDQLRPQSMDFSDPEERMLTDEQRRQKRKKRWQELYENGGKKIPPPIPPKPKTRTAEADIDIEADTPSDTFKLAMAVGIPLVGFAVAYEILRRD